VRVGDNDEVGAVDTLGVVGFAVTGDKDAVLIILLLLLS